jgi:glycerol-3-phosphate dehydrogenase (NAD(P)+)
MKNVIAIAAGIVIGAGLGDSARAALMTRGYAEMLRLALALGARAETLAGLSGLGDLVLTCTSAQSRNFRFGQALGSGQGFDPLVTVEGLATARAVAAVARQRQIDMPITAMIAALVENQITLPEAVQALMSRPLKQE